MWGCLLALLVPLGASAAPLHFSNVFGSSMVLQRGKPIPVWGWGAPGDLITVSFTGLGNLTSTADASGFWRVTFPSRAATASALELAACASSGGCAVLGGVLVGDVVLCSGQSNMEFTVASSVNASAETAAADLFPLIRVTSGPLQKEFSLKKLPPNVLFSELQALDLPWSVADKASIGGNGTGWAAGWDYFSGVCWFYLRDTFLANQAQGEVVPLGGVVQSYGGTSIQWWSSTEALAQCPLAASNPGSACCGYGGSASCLYNSQIHPYTLGPTQFSAVFWYQGEQNAGCGGPAQIDFYTCALPALISDWRVKLGDPALPFGVYLLAPWNASSAAFPMLRLAQVSAATQLPKVATCSTLDAGEPNGGPVHSPYKQLPASRCAAVMQTLVYSRGAGAPPYLGPRAVAATLAPAGASRAAAAAPTTRVTVAFAPGSTLVLNTSIACPPKIFNGTGGCEAFALQRAAPDCSWVQTAPMGPAVASLVGGQLQLDLGDGGSVAAVRGLFANWPLAQLYSAEGLPADPWLLNVSGGGAGCPLPCSQGCLWEDTGAHA